MQLAVASGKGGTGKTTVATNLALCLGDVQLLDCDVEEPNSHIFLDVDLKVVDRVYKRIPRVDEGLCTLCGKCSEFCRKNALAVLPSKLLFFEQLCNGCGGCRMACPESAISEKERELGVVEEGRSGDLEFVRGVLHIGQPMATPVISAVKRRISKPAVILDVPPGTGCPVIECLRGSDFVLLVTEPTPFGLADLKAALDLCEEMELSTGVIVNRVGIGDDRVERYCNKSGIPIMMAIPESIEIAHAYSEGIPFTRKMPEYVQVFRDLYDRVADVTG